MQLSGLQAGFVSQVAGDNESIVAQEVQGATEAEAGPLFSAMLEVAASAAAQRQLVVEGGCIAIALVHEGQLLGTLAVGTRETRTFTREETENLETMATFCAAAVAGLERARLEGVLLAARTAQHELNNRLGVVLGYAEMLAEYPGLPESMNEIVAEIVSGAKDMAETVDQMRRVTRIREAPRPSLTGPTLNLHDSVA
jgi:signal transduction histidine kinase